ncbi:MAG: hypothetical protein AABY51_10055 [Deltaproteobacteria bacterium]
MLGEGLVKGLFGEKGLAGNVIDVLRTTGVLADPEQELKVRQALMDYEVKIGQQEVEDRASARAMQVAALGQDDLFSKRFLYYFASALAFLTFGYIVLATFVPIPTENVRLADMASGILLGTVLTTVVAFFFGSSAGSARKTGMIDRLTK